MANAGCWWNLTDPFDGFLLGKRYVLMDRDTKFCPAFRNILRDEGAEPLLLPPRSPNLNAHLERFMRSLKSEALSRMIFFGEKSPRSSNMIMLRGIIRGLATKSLNRVTKLARLAATSRAVNNSAGSSSTITAMRRENWLPEMHPLLRLRFALSLRFKPSRRSFC